jgi:hypothetical protein
VLGACCLSALAGLRFATAGWNVHWTIDVVGYAAVTALIVSIPALGERLDDQPVVEWVQSRLPFDGGTGRT